MVATNSTGSPPFSSPAVSIIISAYNYGRYIGQTLDSILSQTFQDWECVVVDDGSTDDTDEVVARYAERDRRISYLRQKNQGPAAARNNGLRNTTGRYVQFLDADDLIEPRKLEKQVEYLEQHPEVDIVYGSMRYFLTEDMNKRFYWVWGEDKPWMPEISGAGKDVLTALIRSNIMVINSPLVRRSTIEAVGLYDETLKGPEDWDYWIRCAAAGKRFQYENMDGTLALVRAHQLSISKNRVGMLSNVLRMREKMEKSLVEADVARLNREHLQLDKRLIVRSLVEAAVDRVAHGNRIDGLKCFWKAGMLSEDTGQKIKWMACACVSPFAPRERFAGARAILLEDSLRRIFSYKLKSLFSRPQR